MKPKIHYRHEVLEKPIRRGRYLFTSAVMAVRVSASGSRPLGKPGVFLAGRYVWEDRSRYMPHQGAAECERRASRMGGRHA